MGDESAPPLNLSAEEAEAPARSDYAAYLHEYVPIYGRTVRVIKRWIEIGRAAKPTPELPPLDDPEAMLTWWPRHMKWKVPDELLAAAATAKGRRASAATPSQPTPKGAATPPATPTPEVKAPALPASSAPPPPPPPDRPLVPADFGSVEELTLSEILTSHRQTISFLIRSQRAEAEKGYNADSFARFQNAIERTTELIRKTEASLESIRVKRGELVPKGDVRDELQRVHTAMAMSLATELERKFGVPRDRARTFVNDWFAHLRASPLLAGTEPKPAAPAPAAPLPAAA